MSLTVVEALTAYAEMINTLDASRLEPLLADDFHYASQKVFHEMTSKAEYMEYIVGKLETFRGSGFEVWAEMGELTYAFPGPCVVLAQGEREDLVAVLLAEVSGEYITRIDMCVVPPPESARRSGVYPGRSGLLK